MWHQQNSIFVFHLSAHGDPKEIAHQGNSESEVRGRISIFLVLLINLLFLVCWRFMRTGCVKGIQSDSIRHPLNVLILNFSKPLDCMKLTIRSSFYCMALDFQRLSQYLKLHKRNSISLRNWLKCCCFLRKLWNRNITKSLYKRLLYSNL